MMGSDQKQTIKIQVECYAGSRAEESPRSFSIGHRKIKVSEIIDRWLPAHSYFKLCGDDGGISYGANIRTNCMILLSINITDNLFGQ